MTQSVFNHVKITGIAAVVPEKEICLADEAQYYGNDLKKIERTRKMVGFWKRRVVENGVTASDLCVQAAKRLLNDMSVNKDEIDALVFVVQNPDYSSPATACVIHNQLDLPQSCPAFDVNQGCSGYVYGLWLASSLIEGGQCRKVLLLAGDTSSINADPRNRVTAPVFGDAGTATLIEFSAKENKSFFELGTNGKGYEAIIVPAGCAKIPLARNLPENKELCDDIQNGGNTTHLTDIYMDAAAVFNFTMTVVPPHIKSLMAFANTAPANIDCLVLHQANKQIIQMIGAATGFPADKVPCSTVEKFGNQTIASVPCVLCDVLREKLEKQPLKLLLSGFGVGLSWASCVLETKEIYCADIEDFKPDDSFTARESLIKKWIHKLQGESK